jgi:hypothetical protein
MQPDIIIFFKKKKGEEKKIMPLLFFLMGISVNFEILKPCTLENPHMTSVVL